MFVAHEYQLKRYHARRAFAISYLGGRCVRCGTSSNLEIDHIDSATKTYDLSSQWSISINAYLLELKKCQLLCFVCHKQKSDMEKSVGHGEGRSGKRNCKCQPCRAKKNEYMRNWKRGKI